MMRAVAVLTVIATATVGAGCTGDSPAESGGDQGAGQGPVQLLLTRDEVPGAVSAQALDSLPTVTVCGPVSRGEGRLDTFADRLAVRELMVETTTGQTTVVVALYEGISAGTRRQVIFPLLETGLMVCPRDSPIERGEVVERMARLEGLPEGVVGYSSRITSQEVREAVERVYAAVGSRVLVISAHRIADSETDVSVEELLTTATDKLATHSPTPGRTAG